jgi:DNA-binding CsgD family transcriptional regulator/tetratricopeptide (TPR) repeat protein
MRYVLLQTLRDYGRGLLAREPGEEAQVLEALAGFALTVAGQAGAGLATSGDARELAALCHLDGEDATLAAALDWALDNAPETALRLAVALAPWWLARGRVGEGYTRLAAAARNRPAADAQLWLGIVAQALGRDPDSEAHNSMAVEMAEDPLSQTAILALAGRSVARRSLGQLAQAAEDTERAVELARQSGGQTARAFALGARAQFEGNVPERLAWSRQAADCLDAEVPGRTARQVRNGLALALTLSGQYDDARRLFAADLAWCREAGDLAGLADLLASRIYLEDVAGDYDAMTVYLHEAVEVNVRTGRRSRLRHRLGMGGNLCAATGRLAEAVTLWAAYMADLERAGIAETGSAGRRAAFLRRIETVLEPDRLRAARERGARMTLAAAAEFVALLTEPADTPAPADPTPSGPAPADSARPEPGRPEVAELTPRERELVALVARGQTNSEIAGELFISVRTVASHLDRIRAKTGARRRADLTRLALQENLV